MTVAVAALITINNSYDDDGVVTARPSSIAYMPRGFPNIGGPLFYRHLAGGLPFGQAVGVSLSHCPVLLFRVLGF